MLFYLLFPFLAAAAPNACETKDIRDHLPKRVADYFRRPQRKGGMGWCYAYTAADLLSARLGLPVSPPDVALTYHRFAPYQEARVPDSGPRGYREGTEGGYISESITTARDTRRGVCPESVLPMDSLRGDHDPERFVKALKQLQNFRDRFRRDKREVANFLQNYDCELRIQDQLPHVNINDVLDIVERSAGKTVVEIAGALADKNCAGKRIRVPKDVRPVLIFNDPKFRIAHFIDRALEKNAPVTLSLPYGALSGDLSDKTLHAVTVLGRKVVDGKCHYLIRNNAADSGCGHYAENLRASCTPDDTLLLPEDTIRQMADSIEFLR